MSTPSTAPAEGLETAEGPADAELISAVRGGDLEAYGVLFGRHVEAARRLARHLAPSDADDLVSDAFAKVLGVLQRGGGPDLAFRAYLLTALRRLHVDRIRAGAKVRPTDDLEPLAPGVPFHDTAVSGFENQAAAKAFASLPERWQMVLWHLEVEGQRPADIAPMLGMSANSVSALAYRAREGLRQAFLTMHAQEAVDDDCAWTQQNLGAFVRNGLSRRDRTKVETHLEECRRCTAVYLELTEVNSDLAAILAPLILGGAAAGYLGSVGAGTAAAGAGGLVAGVGALLGRVRDVVSGAATGAGPGTVVAGVAVGALVVSTGVALMIGGDDSPPDSERPGASGPASPGLGDKRPGQRAGGDAKRTGGGTDASDRTDGGTTAVVGTDSSAGSGGAVVDADAGPGTSPADPPQGSGPAPDPGPGSEPGPGPGPGGPAPSPPPPAGTDASVAASAQGHGGLLWEVSLRVTGISPGTRGTVRVSSDAPAAALTLDPRCGLVQVGVATCRVTGPTTLRFGVLPVPGVPTTLTFRIDVAGDPSSANDTTRVTLRR